MGHKLSNNVSDALSSTTNTIIQNSNTFHIDMDLVTENVLMRTTVCNL